MFLSDAALRDRSPSQAPGPRLSQCLSSEVTRETGNLKQKFSCLEINLLLPTKSKQNYLWKLFCIIKGMINRCYVHIKLCQVGLSQFTNRGNRKHIPSGMLLDITVFFFLSHNICDCSRGFNRRENIILAIGFWCIVGDCSCLSMQEAYKKCFSIFKSLG